MKIKRYVASTMEEALKQVKDDLGRHAIILQTLRHRPVLGLFGQEQFEVVAGTDATLKVVSDRRSDRSMTKEEAAQQPFSVPGVAARAYEGMTTSVAGDSDVGQTAATAVEKIFTDEDQDDLLAMGFQPGTVNRLLEGGARPGSDAFSARLRELARPRYSTRATNGVKRPRTAALIGATGSGKTTTLARLAARAVSQDQSIALITMDTQRVGAVEQLRSFSDILQALFFVAYTGDDLKDALQRAADTDLVLIDTAGRAPNDAVALGQLRQALEQVELDETHLVMPVTTRLPDAQRLFRVYRSLGPNRLVLTKLDETQALGGLLEIPQQVPLPVSYLTYGQRIPEDMEAATPEAVSRLVVAGLQTLRRLR